MEIKKIEVEPNQFIWVDLKAKIKEGDKVWWENPPEGENSQINTAVEVYDAVIFMDESEIGAYPDEVFKIVAASPELKLDVPNYDEFLATKKLPSWSTYTDNNPEGFVDAFIQGYQTAEKELSDELFKLTKQIERLRLTMEENALLGQATMEEAYNAIQEKK